MNAMKNMIDARDSRYLHADN